jgi:NAD(P)H-flavin reductase
LYRVSRARREIRDTWTLDLEPANGSPIPEFAPGQFSMLYVFGVGEVPISISGSPQDGNKLVHTVRGVGAVSRRICSLKKGDTLGVRGPYGSHWPVTESPGKDLFIAAGGIGLAPLRPVLYQVLAQRESFGQVVLLYGARSPSDILFPRELERWKSAGVEVQVTVDRGATGWSGPVGVVTTLIPRLTFDPLNTVAMVCGPEIMMRYTITQLVQRGVTEERIFISMERNMKCGIGLCGHCQYGPSFICQDGPVFPFSLVRNLFSIREV